jgi:muramidase (phage lysozyme)
MNKLQKILTMMAFMLAANGTKVVAYIDMHALAMIESSNNPKAYNKKSKATGLYQITPICLKDFNRSHPYKLTLKDMFEPAKAEVVARWYLAERLTNMIGWMGLPVTTQRILWAWHAGIRNCADGVLPEATRAFINKYNAIARRGPNEDEKGKQE